MTIQDPFAAVRDFWSQWASSPAGSLTQPMFDPVELEKRLNDLKQVRLWLETSLNMLNLQTQAIEMHLNVLKGSTASLGALAPTGIPPFPIAGTPTAFAMPFSPQQKTEPLQKSVMGNDTNSHSNTDKANPAPPLVPDLQEMMQNNATLLQSMPWVNPGEWIKAMHAAMPPPSPTSSTPSSPSSAPPSSAPPGRPTETADKSTAQKAKPIASAPNSKKTAVKKSASGTAPKPTSHPK